MLQRLFDAEAISVYQSGPTSTIAETSDSGSEAEQLVSHVLAYLNEAEATQPLFTSEEIVTVRQSLSSIT